MSAVETAHVGDVLVEDHGSIAFLVPISDAGRAWIDENVSQEGYQPYIGRVLVEPRYVGAIVDGMVLDGLDVIT